MFLFTKFGNLLSGKFFAPAVKYYLKREEFYDMHSYSMDAGKLVNLLGGHADFNTNVPVSFKGLQWGTSMRNVISTLGYPKFIKHKTIGGKDHSIIFYREELGGFGVVSQLHFLENELFMANYMFRYAGDKDINKIFGSMRRKYLGETTDLAFSEGVTIKDTASNLIRFEMDIYPTIFYGSGDSKIINFFQSIIDKQKDDKRRKEDKKMEELFQNL